MSRTADPKAKQAILRAAEDVFTEKGLAGAKVEEIAKRAGLSKGAFYLHFESKEAAFLQIVEEFLGRLTATFGAPSEYSEIPSEPYSLLDFVYERDLRILEFLWDNRKLSSLLASCQGDYIELLLQFRSEIAARTRAWIDQFRQDGLYREEVDTEVAEILLAGAYNELSIRMLGHKTRPPIEAWVAQAQDTFVRAFGSPPLVHALERKNRASGVGTMQTWRAEPPPASGEGGD